MKKKLILIMLGVVLVLSACGNNDKQVSPSPSEDSHKAVHDSHTSSGEIPKNLKVADNPTYPVGSEAIINDGHMEGMKGATATIVGAFDTIAYAVSYTPTSGGERVTNHKWIVHEEISNAAEKAYEAGAEVNIEADHMDGMKGATGTIDSAEQTTMYMIDYTPTTGGDKVTNHKWVTESELSSVK